MDETSSRVGGCHRCGAPIDEVDGLPLCGDCVRDLDEEADLAVMDLQDGELNGIIGW